MKRVFRLTRSRDFRQVKEIGLVIHHPLLILVYARNEELFSRAAVVASRKTGNAVERNRMKRRIRACLQFVWPRVLPSWDLVFYSRVHIKDADFKDIENAVIHLLKQADVLGEDE